MNKLTAGIATFALAATLAACGRGIGTVDQDMPEYDAEHRQACYTQQGRFAEYDDDCHDDGNITYREMLARRAASQKANPMPVRTSGGLRTAGPARKPTPVRVPVNRH